MAEIATTAREAPQAWGLAPGSDAEARHLTTLVARNRAICTPARIYLFGSRAHGTAGNESDIDLLVVLPEKQATRAYWATLLDETASGPVSVDVALSTPDELAWRSQVPGFVEYDACRHGCLLHG
ncbi:MAG TPA: nucleotidyltransferase domain-containing protein [Chloroflexota bacterium]|nr:nucleotidyltransferase domain-containing protein [Chloroflexota bacterium]